MVSKQSWFAGHAVQMPSTSRGSAVLSLVRRRFIGMVKVSCMSGPTRSPSPEDEQAGDEHRLHEAHPPAGPSALIDRSARERSLQLRTASFGIIYDHSCLISQRNRNGFSFKLVLSLRWRGFGVNDLFLPAKFIEMNQCDASSTTAGAFNLFPSSLSVQYLRAKKNLGVKFYPSF